MAPEAPGHGAQNSERHVFAPTRSNNTSATCLNQETRERFSESRYICVRSLVTRILETRLPEKHEQNPQKHIHISNQDPRTSLAFLATPHLPSVSWKHVQKQVFIGSLITMGRDTHLFVF